MQVNYEDGTTQSYRIIPENSTNGVIISHLPRNHQEALLFWQDQLPAKVKTISLQATNPHLYKSDIQIYLTSASLKISRNL